jgi:cytochrome c-type biogenesis protein CcmE
MQNSTIAKIALTAAVLTAGVAFFAKSTAGSTQHYKMVDELLATGDLSQWHDKQMKVHGYVVAGSIKEKVVNQETQRTFLLHKSGKKIRVFNKGPKPDTFKDQSEVVATGTLVSAASMAKLAESLDVRIDTDMLYVVDATDLMAKCPSKYEGAQANKQLDDNAPKFK